jgi:SNF2 family DNA or RNA helicase
MDCIEQPQNVFKSLFPHQLSLVYKMEKIEHDKTIDYGSYMLETKLAINADITGYGKTLSMVALIARDKMQWESTFCEQIKTIFANGKTTYIKKNIKTPINCTIVLVSSSICKQWVKELECTNLRYIAITKNKLIETVNPHEYDVILVISTMFNKFIQKYNNCAWKRFVYDEPGSLRVSAMNSVSCGFTWFVCATPESIQQTHMYCHSVMSLIVSDSWNFILPMITIKNDDEYVKASFRMPETFHHYYNCYSPIYNVVNGIVNDKVKEMIEAGNICEAIIAMGGKTTDNIIDVIRKNKEIELEEIRSRIRIWTIRNNEERIIAFKMKEKTIVGQIEQLEKRFNTMLQSDCIICRDTLRDPILEPNCQNIFCGKCLLTWISKKSTCPLCRCSVDQKNLIHIISDASKVKCERKEPTKEEIIVDIIKKNPLGRFIIYSKWHESFDSIRNILKECMIDYIELTGTTEHKDALIEEFKSGKTRTIFLNPKNNPIGVDLPETTDIILYHQMDESSMKQVIGRANRIGRTISLSVHHLLVKEE